MNSHENYSSIQSMAKPLAKPLRLTCAALAFSLLQSLHSHAGVIIDISTAVTGTSQDFKNTTNHIIGKKNGYFGANLFTDDAELSNITVEFLGSQAKWDLWFTIGNGEDSWTIHNHPDGAKGIVKANDSNRQQGSISIGANQLIDFSFFIDNPYKGSGYDWRIDNGSNALPVSLDANGGRYFWTGFEYDTAGNIIAIILGADDSGAAFDEDNDDLMVRLSGFGQTVFRTQSIPEIPLPSTLGLFGTALGVTALMREKKQRRKKTAA